MHTANEIQWKDRRKDDIYVEIDRRCWRYLDHTLKPDLERITKCVKLTGLDQTGLDWTEKPKGTCKRTIKTKVKTTRYEWNDITRNMIEADEKTLLPPFVQKYIKKLTLRKYFFKALNPQLCLVLQVSLANMALVPTTHVRGGCFSKSICLKFFTDILSYWNSTNCLNIHNIVFICNLFVVCQALRRLSENVLYASIKSIKSIRQKPIRVKVQFGRWYKYRQPFKRRKNKVIFFFTKIICFCF